MPSNDREVFAYLQDDKDTSLASDFITYAMFAGEKQQWINLWEAKNGAPPSQADIDNWISNLTDSQFMSIRAMADTYFAQVAEEYLAERIEVEKANILRSAVVREIKAAGSFWKQLALALTTSILAPLILGAIIGLAILYDKGMFTASGVAQQFQGAKPAAPDH